MLALIIADNSFASRERALLSRLEVGLADEGVRVIHAVPASALRSADAHTLGIQSTTVAYHTPALALQSLARRSAIDLLAAVDGTSEDPLNIDIVHAFGASAWPIALEVARAAREGGAALLIELWHPGLVPAAAELLARVRKKSADASTPEFLTSEAPVATALTMLDPRARVYSAPWGVHVPAKPRTILPTADRDLSFAVLYDTGDPRTLAAPLAGIAEATAGLTEALIVGAIDDATSRREARLWSTARKLKLLDRFSILPDMEARREPVLAMDFLLLPEPRGRQRTLTLEAMARGMAVIAARDDTLELLQDGTTARIVADNSPKAWADAIRTLITNPAAHTDLTGAAHQHMRSHRTASTHIADVLRAYQQAVAARNPAAIA